MFYSYLLPIAIPLAPFAAFIDVGSIVAPDDEVINGEQEGFPGTSNMSKICLF